MTTAIATNAGYLTDCYVTDYPENVNATNGATITTTDGYQFPPVTWVPGNVYDYTAAYLPTHRDQKISDFIKEVQPRPKTVEEAYRVWQELAQQQKPIVWTGSTASPTATWTTA